MKKYQPEKKVRIVSDILSKVRYIVEEEALNAEQLEELSGKVKAKPYISDEMWSMAENAFRGAVAGANTAIAGKYYAGLEESKIENVGEEGKSGSKTINCFTGQYGMTLTEAVAATAITTIISVAVMQTCYSLMCMIREASTYSVGSDASLLKMEFAAAMQQENGWEIITVPEKIDTLIIHGIPMYVLEPTIETFPAVIQEAWTESFPAYVNDTLSVVLGPQAVERDFWDNIISAEGESDSKPSNKPYKNNKEANKQAQKQGYKDAHELKEDYVGKSNVSKYDMKYNTKRGKYT